MAKKGCYSNDDDESNYVNNKKVKGNQVPTL
jgi:hypothetical protein